MGVAAPQIGISRAAAVVIPPDPGAEPLVIFNLQVIRESAETDEPARAESRPTRREVRRVPAVRAAADLHDLPSAGPPPVAACPGRGRAQRREFNQGRSARAVM